VVLLGVGACRPAAPPVQAPTTTAQAEAPKSAPSAPLTTGATDLYFKVHDREVKVGDEVFMELVAGRTFPENADGTVVAVLIKPDGTRVKAEIFVGPTESTAFCLPTKGSGGCEHDRRREPFHSTPLYFGAGRTEFDQPGRYRLELRSRRWKADPVEIVAYAH